MKVGGPAEATDVPLPNTEVVTLGPGGGMLHRFINVVGSNGIPEDEGGSIRPDLDI